MKPKYEIRYMQILIIAATAQEIQPLLDIESGHDILITGVGIPSTIYHLQKRVLQIDYDLVIQAGIAGTFKPEILLGQTVMIKQDCFADLGIEENNIYRPVFETGLTDKNEFPFENGWLINTHKILSSSALPAVNAISINKVSDSGIQKEQFLKLFNADIESMEGAALHYVCLLENIPFIQLRSVSNHVGERDKTKWKMKEAIQHLNESLTALINGLTDQQ